jgi:hypothetical protein
MKTSCFEEEAYQREESHSELKNSEEEDHIEYSMGKRGRNETFIYKNLKNKPKPIVTLGQRKQKENQIRENPKQAKKITNKWILLFSLNQELKKEKQTEKDLRNKEKADISISLENQNSKD